MKKLTSIIVLCLYFNCLSLSAQEQSKQDSVQKLNEVEVTARKALIKQKPDRIIYNLQADPESKGSSLLNMMKKVPYLTVDAADRVLLKGNSNFKVLLNGKPSVILESNLSDLLKTMPANTIQSIEVITIPPSKYDAEGLAGIINIITLKKTENGYNGNLNMYQQFPAAGPSGGGSLTLKQGKLGVSAFGGAGWNDVPETGNSTVRSTTGASSGLLTQTGKLKSQNNNGYFGTEISYEIDSLNLLSGQFNFYGNHADESGRQQFMVDQSSTGLQQYGLDNSGRASTKVNDLSLNYQLGFSADKRRLLTFSYQHSTNNRNQFNQVLVSNPVNYQLPDYQQRNKVRFSEQTMQIDYVYPTGKFNIESGIKAILRDQSSNFQYLSDRIGNDNFEFQPDQSDLFNYSQKVFSAYNSYALNIKSWSFQAGLRIEQTVVDAQFVSNASEVAQRYLRLIPALSANKNFPSGNSLNFGFTQRIKRPGINRLNPFVNRSNPNFETTGNPNLEAVLVNDIQAGYHIAGKTSITIGLDYSFLSNADLAVATFDPVTQITRTSYQNTGRIDGLSAFINVSRSITRKWNASLNVNLIYFYIAGEADGGFVEKKLLTSSVNLSSGYDFNQGWRLNGNLNIQSRNPTGFQGTTNGMISTALSINKEILKDKLSVAAVASNLFVKYRDAKTFTNAVNFSQTSVVQNYFNSYRLSINYNFGELKGKIRKNQREIRNNDQSN
ncbi:outer membrane beta-barrel protein [Pedobacter sp. MC2016-15]|uniref:outer membrane beta-barrel protein n=1 Tax=Pedobacter sp. MC2016-15 TaxID=2994473 RepID=UPI002246FD31|nr:outer membrane beta-barrel protein [Pedobacter sp. MC2016-15]MCX2479778.1 outer membrane beta-barrel protein [Pedobacter sp. MC2016-15]